MAVNIDEKQGSATFNVRVIPRSSKREIVGEHDGALKVKLKSPPVDGAANDELIRVLSKEFGVSRSAIEIVSGLASKTKRVQIRSVDTSHILAVLKAKS
jgi:uncharacterized protein (TIGR00251 family)